MVEISYSRNGEQGAFIFGGLCVVESMAYIIETDPGDSSPPDIPYLSAEKLVDLIYPSFGQNRLNLLALCDCSLQRLDPGYFFYQTLLDLANTKHQFTTPEDIYTYCANIQVNFNFAGKDYQDLSDLYLDFKNEAKEQLRKYFNDPYFDPIKLWLDGILESSFLFRMANPTFPLDIARGGKITANNAFIAFFNYVGTPLISNKNADAIIFDPRATSPDTHYPILWAIEQIHNIFWGEQKQCEMVGLCAKSNIAIDSRCINAPWERANDTPPCPFALVWKHWALSNHSPIF